MGNTPGSSANPAEAANASKRPNNKMKAIHMRLLRIKNRGSKSSSAKIHHQQAAPVAVTLHETKEVTAINSMLTEEEIKNIQVHTC